MTIVSLLLSVYPIPYREDYLIHLTFVPLLFLGRFYKYGLYIICHSNCSNC